MAAVTRAARSRALLLLPRASAAAPHFSTTASSGAAAAAAAPVEAAAAGRPTPRPLPRLARGAAGAAAEAVGPAEVWRLRGGVRGSRRRRVLQLRYDPAVSRRDLARGGRVFCFGRFLV